ncbi:MAG TPA: hypothetical protein VEN81_10675, partial [Planctomycetota bacterium]|nr:hypothetical protein [Planctomycetota bacterium]
MNEKPGTLIGLSNVMTRVSARTAPGPDPDAQPGLRDRLRTRAMRALEGRESYIHDAIVLGRRVRLFSNSHHLADFWKENWPGEADWKVHTGSPLPREAILTVHAMIDVEGEPEASYFSASQNEVYLFNTSYYADLRACTMEALGRTLLAEGRFLHGTAVESGGRMLLCLYPKEVIHPTPAWGLLEAPGSRLLGDGWLFRDTAGRLSAIEKGLYLRTSFVESYPDHAAKLLRSKFENVPDATPALADPKMPFLQGLLEGAARNDPRGVLRGLPTDRQKDLLLRLIVSPDSRVLVDPAAILGKSRLLRGPAAPAAVFDLK